MAAALFGNSQNSGDEGGLNAIAAERAKLAAFTDRKGLGKRGRLTIGLICSLSSYGYLPLWHTLFTTLGYSVAVPHLDRLSAFTAQAVETITSEHLCSPAKSAHGRIFEMQDRGVDALFAPKYNPAALCAVLCNYSQVIKNNIPSVIDGSVGLIAPSLEDVKLREFYDDPTKFMPALDAIRSFDTTTSPNEDEFRKALDRALEVQRRFDDEVVELHRKTVDRMFHEENAHAVILAGRPYQLADDLLRGVDKKFADHGYLVLSPLATRISLRQIPPSSGEDPTYNQGTLLRWIANNSIDESSINVVFLQTAECGYDAANIAEAERILIDGNRRCAVVNLDSTPEEITQQVEDAIKEFKAEHTRREMEESETLSPSQAIEFLMDSYKEESLRIDAQKRFSDLPESLCNTVTALFRDSLDSFAGDPDLEEVHLPAVCKGCLVEMLPSLLSRNLDRDVKVIWEDRWIETPDVLSTGQVRLAAFSDLEQTAFQDEASEMFQRPSDFSPVIGLAGNPLLCFNDSVVSTLKALVEKSGASLLLPDPVNFHPEDGYSEQLEAYGQKGVDGVLCLQDAHCLKEHVSIRGSLAGLQRRFPSMQLIAIEVSDDVSPAVLENRVVLAVYRIMDKKNAQARSGSEQPVA